MSGRIEDAIKIEERIKKKLELLPPIITEYYKTIAASKEPKTCEEYISKIYKMLERCCDDPKTFDFSTIDESFLSNYMIMISRKKLNGRIEETSFAYRKLNWSVLNGLCKYLYRKKIIPENYMEYIDRPTTNDVVNRKLLTIEDFRKLYDIINMDDPTGTRIPKEILVRNKLMFLLLMNTGMRETALSHIDISDIDFENGVINVIDKRHKTLRYKINDPVLLETLFEWLDVRAHLVSTDVTTDALFVTNSGERITARIVREVVESYTKKNFDTILRPHKLRSGFCSILYEQTRDIEFVRDAVGHESVEMTKRYIVKKESAQELASGMMGRFITGRDDEED